MKHIHTKNFIKLSTIVFVLMIGIYSCTDLSEDPFNEITEENFNPTERDIPRLLGPAYARAWFMGCCYDYISMQEGAGDSYVTPARPNGWGGPYLPYHYHEWTPVHPHVTTGWNQLFNGINAANRVYFQIEGETIQTDSEQQTRLLAELRAIRAYYYYHLMDNYGDVPIVTDFTDESLPVQSTRQEVFDFVVAELTTAMPNLSEQADNTTYGRMNRWAALATLARVYLNAEVYTGTPGWTEVINYTDQIINSGLFELNPDYRNNFTIDNNNSNEIIFAVPYDEVFAGGNTMHMRTLAPEQQQSFQMAAQPWGGSAATPQSIETYDEDDTRLDDTWSGGPQLDLQGNVVIDFSFNIPSIEATEFRHGYRVNKYEIYPGMQVASSVDLPLFRYSMVLMMKAEALLRTGNADEAATLVTQVRERAFVETNPADAVVTGAELQQGSSFNYGIWDGENEQVDNPVGGNDIQYGRFLDELLWEFGVEGFRRQDLIRFDAYDKPWFKKSSTNEPCRTIFPIPQEAIDDNPNLEQRNNCFD